MNNESASGKEPPAGASGASGADRLTEPADGSRRPRLPFPVVGIGASAGGLEAYTEFLKAAAADAGLAFVLIQHLSPDRESLVVELLARHTAMPVAQVVDGQPVEPNHVYVIRPGHTLTLRDGRLRLGEPLAARGHGRPIDDFFRSLAEEQQQRAIAVVLSGMGSNGTAGAEAVEAVGGLVIAQDPETTSYPSMPRSLIDANVADFILRPEEMPAVIARYAAEPYVATDRPAESVSRRDEQALVEILGVLRARVRHDFSGYRKPTLVRRIFRRMGLGQVPTMADYVKSLRQSATEVTALADDLLIHVTGFFRDPEAWDALRDKVIGPLADERPDGSPIRAWVTACATGEEAYSLAILLVEAAEQRGKAFDIKVFATDMAERALGHARSGVFPGGIESEVSPERLDRFFDKDDSAYRVKRILRELVVFAPQNVLQDPPFSRLDIITCRNLLIYLEPEVQRRILALLHFGLRDGGALLLGNSESAGATEDEFQVIDKKNRLFRRVSPARPGSLEFPLPTARLQESLSAVGHPRAARQSVAQLANRALLDGYTPAAVVVDAQGQIVYFHGDTARYLDQPRGDPTRDLLTLANEQVRGSVRTALHRAAEVGHAVTVLDGLIETREGRRRVEVGTVALDRRPRATTYLVTFRDYPEPPPLPPAGDAGPTPERQLVEELQRVRDELQGALEEAQTSNEEMKAAHEEVTSINEELQSTNEELETSKEELQSLNEELTTVNAQLRAKMAELEATTNDLASLLTSSDIAVLFLDQRFRIRRFTPALRDLLDLIPSDAGRPLVDMRRKFADPDLLADAQQVLDRLVPVERGVTSDSGREYIRRILPYRTSDNRIDGVVVTFVDVTERQRAEAALAAEQDAMTRLHDLSDRLHTALDLPTTVGHVLDTAIALHGADRGTVQVYDPTANGLRYAASRGFDPAALDAIPIIDRDFHSTCAAALRTGERVVAADIPADTRFGEHAATAGALGYRAAISTPLTTRKGELQGVLSVYFREPHIPTDRELRLADLYTVLAAHLIERHRAEAVLREDVDELTRFNRATVSRESRMIELKKEVNELCRRVGEPKRYPLDFESGEGGHG